MKYAFAFLTIIIGLTLEAQSNILSTNLAAKQVMLGNYNPADYASTNPISHHDDIIQGINANINADSLKVYLEEMASFSTRNTGSDTVSSSTGIGAARRWAYQKFESFSQVNENRLITSYLQFDQTICSMAQHRNVFAVLPGTDTIHNRIILIEAHFDSRCDQVCDVNCVAEGMEDNGSGSALVLELARVMSQYTYKSTIVFMLTIGEEQGLYGSNAFSQFSVDNDIPIHAVLNNDVIGGVICGATSSAPSCPGENAVDSTQVRFFSKGGFDSQNKQLARYLKLQYQEELKPLVNVPMSITIMSGEDRAGRGGDHIPFRQDGFRAMRFTSAHEHGDASNGVGYTDRQHTSTDILGVDTNGDMVIDSFFVDFNYLARNATINGVGAAMIAIGPKVCDLNIETSPGPEIIIKITEQTNYDHYRVGLRTINNDWDSVYVIDSALDTIFPTVANDYIVSVASVDEYGIESLFSREILLPDDELSIAETNDSEQGIELLQNHPNPFDEATIITVKLNEKLQYQSAQVIIRDIQGKEIERLPIRLENQMNEVLYNHGYKRVGTYTYTLVIDGRNIATKMMVFAN